MLYTDYHSNHFFFTFLKDFFIPWTTNHLCSVNFETFGSSCFTLWKYEYNFTMGNGNIKPHRGQGTTFLATFSLFCQATDLAGAINAAYA